MVRTWIRLLLVATLLFAGGSSAEGRPGKGQSSGPRRGVWVQTDDGKLHKVSRADFRERFGVTWRSRQVLGPGFSEANLPGYTDGPGFRFDADGELVDDQKVAPEHTPGAAELRAIRGQTAPLYIGKVDKVGHGLFARKAIKPGQVIGEYTGVVAEPVNVDPRNGYRFVYDPTNAFRLAVDAQRDGNYLRFANHSTSTNAASRMVYDESHRRWHVLLIATARIEPRDQILFDYGPGYDWRRFGLQPLTLEPRARP